MAEAKKQSEALVTIENKKRRMKTYNLEGEHMRNRPDFGYQRIVQYQTVTHPRTGRVGQKRGRTSSPSSITFCAREKKVNLPHALSVCPDIKAAKDRGDLKITYQDGPIEVKALAAKVRKTTLQLQQEADEAAQKREDDHAKSELVTNAAKKPEPEPKASKRSGARRAPSSSD